MTVLLGMGSGFTVSYVSYVDAFSAKARLNTSSTKSMGYSGCSTGSFLCSWDEHSWGGDELWWGQLVTSPLWAQQLSFEHLLEVAKTDRQTTSKLSTERVSRFCLPIAVVPPQVIQPALWHTFILFYSIRGSCGRRILWRVSSQCCLWCSR